MLATAWDSSSAATAGAWPTSESAEAASQSIIHSSTGPDPRAESGPAGGRSISMAKPATPVVAGPVPLYGRSVSSVSRSDAPGVSRAAEPDPPSARRSCRATRSGAAPAEASACPASRCQAARTEAGISA